MADLLLPPSFPTAELLLRAPTRNDVPGIVDACQDREISRWTTIPWPYTTADALSFVERAAEQALQRSAQDYVITRRDDGRLLGMCGVHHVDEPAATTQLGYWLGPSARRQGFGTLAITTLVREVLIAGFERIEAEVLVGNEASRRLLSRVGFVEEGVLRSVYAGGCGTGVPRIDVHLYSLIRSDATAEALIDG